MRQRTWRGGWFNYAYNDEPTWFLLGLIAVELAVVIVLLAVGLSHP